MRNFLEFVNAYKKQCLIVGVLCLLVFWLGSLLLKDVNVKGAVQECPASTLKDIPVELPTAYEEYEMLDMCIRCPGTGYTLWVPQDAKIDGDTAKAVVDGLDIAVTVSDKGMEEVACSYLPKQLYVNVVGYSPDSDMLLQDSGYLYTFPAQYAVSRFSTKVSVRTITRYLLTYSIQLSKDDSLYIAVSAPSKKEMGNAKALLDVLASSVREYEDAGYEIQNAMLSQIDEYVKNEGESVSGKGDVAQAEKKPAAGSSEDNAESKKEDAGLNVGIHDISFTHSFDRAVTDGVLVVMWENYMAKPVSLEVYGPDGYELSFLSEESFAGFYVYAVKNAAAGDYVFKGETDTVLQDVYVELYEKDDYDVLFSR